MDLLHYSSTGIGAVAERDGRQVLIARLNTKVYGHMALEIAMTLALAREMNADVYFDSDKDAVNPALFDLDATGVTVLRPRGFRQLTFRNVLRRRLVESNGRAGWDDYLRTTRLDVAREMARQAGNTDYPKELRERLRKVSKRVGAGPHRSWKKPGKQPTTKSNDHVLYYRRRLLRDPVPVHLRTETAGPTDQAAEALGITRETKVVAIHARSPGFKGGWDIQDVKVGSRDESFRNVRIESYFDAIDYLVGEGYTVVRIGDPSMDPLRRRGVIDLATSFHRTAALEVYVLLRSAFLMVGDSGPHLVSYLTNTPLLMVNATDPVLVYPVRANGLYLLKTVVDLDTGRELQLSELLTDAYYGHLRSPKQYRYRPNTSEEIVTAVEEMVTQLRSPSSESPAQNSYRRTVTTACDSLTNKFVRKWASDDGFLGDGRAVQFYANRWF
jgi:putative glycosyltransferase (TIGR04372 family)